MCAYNLSTWEVKAGGSGEVILSYLGNSRPAWVIQDPTGDLARGVVRYLPSMCEAPGSTAQSTKYILSKQNTREPRSPDLGEHPARSCLLLCQLATWGAREDQITAAEQYSYRTRGPDPHPDCSPQPLEFPVACLPYLAGLQP